MLANKLATGVHNKLAGLDLSSLNVTFSNGFIYRTVKICLLATILLLVLYRQTRIDIDRIINKARPVSSKLATLNNK